MKLAVLKLNNFRSYRTPTELRMDAFTAIVGCNDVGKSTLLEAMEIFFNNQSIKVDPSDPCVHTGGRSIEITCVFEDLPPKLIIDSRSETTLAAEWLLNDMGQLEIVKRYDCATKTPKLEVFARALTSTNQQLNDLLSIKNADLKARATALSLTFICPE